MLNNFKAFGQKRGIACVHLNVVAAGAAHFQANGLAHDEGHGLGFRLAHSLRGHGAALCLVEKLVTLCCRQHKRTYVAQRFMWRSRRDLCRDERLAARERHIRFC